MKSSEVHAALVNIANHPGKLDKLALIKEGLKDEDFKRVVIAALNPFMTYGIATLPKKEQKGSGEFCDETWNLLSMLERRHMTGGIARDEVFHELNRMNDASAELLGWIITKDIRAGFSESSVNKVSPGLIPEFPYMRCSLPSHTKIEEWPWAEGVVSQEKADGMFANVTTEADGTISITSRQGSPFPMERFQAIADEMRACYAGSTQTHGEFLVKLDGVILERQKSNGVMNRILSGGDWEPGETPMFLAWDQIPLSSVVKKGKCKTPYKERLQGLIAQLKGKRRTMIDLVPTKIVYSIEEAYQHYSEFLKAGKEGTIIKHPAAIWKDGTSKELVKLKLEVDCELKVVGFNEGTGKNEGSLGSLVCRTSCDSLEVNVSGRGDDMRAEVWANKDAWLDSIITVKSNGIMMSEKEGKPHSLFLPIFVEKRTDKAEADSMVRVKEQFDNAIKAVAA